MVELVGKYPINKGITITVFIVFLFFCSIITTYFLFLSIHSSAELCQNGASISVMKNIFIQLLNQGMQSVSHNIHIKVGQSFITTTIMIFRKKELNRKELVLRLGHHHFHIWDHSDNNNNDIIFYNIILRIWIATNYAYWDEALFE